MEPNFETTKELVQLALGQDDDAAAAADRVLSRLHDLPATGPAARRHPSSSRTGRLIRWTSLAAAAVVLANLVAARVAPGYAVELADAPMIGALSAPVLELAGLGPSQLTVASSSASVGGHTITVVGGFADTSRPVVVIQVDGRDSLPSKFAAGYTVLAVLTDQNGHPYGQGAAPANQELVFPPLVGPARHGAVRLTLHITQSDMYSASSPSNPGTQSRLSGNGTIGLTLTQRPAQSAPLPVPVTFDGITYKVTSITVSGTDVSVDWRAFGGAPISQFWNLTRGPSNKSSATSRLTFQYFFALIEPAHGDLATSNLGPNPSSPFKSRVWV